MENHHFKQYKRKLIKVTRMKLISMIRLTNNNLMAMNVHLPIQIMINHTAMIQPLKRIKDIITKHVNLRALPHQTQIHLLLRLILCSMARATERSIIIHNRLSLKMITGIQLIKEHIKNYINISKVQTITTPKVILHQPIS